MVVAVVGEGTDRTKVIGNSCKIRADLGELHAGNGRGNAAKRTAGRTAGLGIPGLELARSAAEEKQQHFFVRLPRRLRQRRMREQSGETRGRRRPRCRQTLQEEPSMQPMLVGPATHRC